MHTLIVLVLKACLISDPTQCGTSSFQTPFTETDQCWHFLPTFLPQFVIGLQSTHPEFQVTDYACVKITPGRDS